MTTIGALAALSASGRQRLFLAQLPTSGCDLPGSCYAHIMDLHDQFQRYFGTTNLSSATPAVLASGTEHLLVDFGLEKNRERRFALWTVLYMLGASPDLDVAFKAESDREAARNFMDLMSAAQPD